jgi:hypothetical protein
VVIFQTPQLQLHPPSLVLRYLKQNSWKFCVDVQNIVHIILYITKKLVKGLRFYKDVSIL